MFGIFKNLFARSDNSQLVDALKNGAFLVDVRSPAEYSGSSVVGAVNIPLDKIPSRLNEFKGKQHIIVFCRSGSRSSQAMSILHQNGFQRVVNGGTWQHVQQLLAQTLNH